MTPVNAVKTVVKESGASISMFLILLLAAIGNWGVNLGEDITFVEMLTPFHVFSFIAVIGTTGGAYFLKAPKKPN